ncbi:hypothetical protein DPMN_176419 [Dreissena polymorpha]|uniref:Uncharacterized protein n=1 Tax=Dreissena polymorpha TaxID=45954 RepID=A0A9D4IKK3_DREPO|nr:hypothetical protein DPMN_176419 [Dreissena polymorpha]
MKAIALWVKLSADASKPDTDTDIAVGEGKAGSDKNVTETTAATQEKTGKKLDTKSLHDIVEEDTDIDDVCMTALLLLYLSSMNLKFVALNF